ncbi:hypothetical protein JCM8097_006825 [Rhodosporidiobolus ruineniae]
MSPAPPPPSPPLAHLPTQSLRELLAPCTVAQGPALTFTNWATTFRSTAALVFRPTSVEEVRWAVELARRERKELRAAGAGHSPSDIVCTEGYVLDLKGLDRVLDVDADSQTFHAEGGILLRNLHPVLLEKGQLALSSLGSISDQTLAGAISTSTHGSGVTYGSLSSCTTFVDLVLPLPGAPVVRCSREQDSDLFFSAVCGIGAVGIVVGVGMRAEPAFKLEEECFSMRFDEFTARWREIAESAEHVRCWWFPQIGRVKVSRMNRTTKAITRPPSALSTYLVGTLLAKRFHAVALTFARVFSSLLPYHAWVMWTFVHQPGPVRWGRFLSGLLGGIWGGGVWPKRREELAGTPEEEEPVQVVGALGKGEEEKPSPASSAPSSPTPPSPAAFPFTKPTLAVLPSDILTPPLTPPVTSPRLGSPSASPTRRSSPLAASSVTEVLEQLPVAEMAEAHEKEVEKVAIGAKLPWPILEDEPEYRVAAGVDIFNYDCGFPQYTYETSVPYTSTAPALSALEQWHTDALYEKGYPLKAHFPIEIRWTKEDDVWLSPTYGQRGTYLGAIQYRPFNLPIPYRSCFAHFATLLSQFSSRPHWAKSHHLSPSSLRSLYPRFDDFLAVRERVDPEGVLVNSYVRRHLLGTEGGEGEEMVKSVRRFKERA